MFVNADVATSKSLTPNVQDFNKHAELFEQSGMWRVTTLVFTEGWRKVWGEEKASESGGESDDDVRTVDGEEDGDKKYQ